MWVLMMVLGELLRTRYHREAKLSTGSPDRLVNSEEGVCDHSGVQSWLQNLATGQ